MTLRLGGDGAITGCTSLENPDLTVSGLTISGSFDAEKVLVASGTAAAPSYTFSGDTDNGLYYAGTNSIGLSTAGANAILIDSTGNVGIGTTSPGYKCDIDVTGSALRLNSTTSQALLVISSDDAANAKIEFGDESDNDRGAITYDNPNNALIFQVNAAERARIDSSGNVGIGETSMDALLVIKGASDAATTPSIRLKDGSDTREAWISNASGDLVLVNGGNDNVPHCKLHLLDANIMRFDTANTERMRIDSSGRLLVGTSTARSNFFNTGTISALFQTEGAAAAGDPAGRFVSQVYGRNNADGPLHILAKHRGTSVGGTTVVANGDVLGTLSFQGSDGAQFVEAASIAAFVDSTPGSNDMPGRLQFYTTADGASSPTERMRITNGGEVRIGTTSAGAGAGFATKIAVAGGDTAMFKAEGVGATSAAPLRAWHDATSGNNLLQMFHTDTALNTRGTITYDRSTNLLQYNTTSDARLKTNITDASSALSDLGQVRVRSFDWIENGHNRVNYGFVAQELNDIAPYAVSEGDHEDEVSIQWGVSNSSMVPLLTKALQEAIAKIETLEAEVAALKNN